MTGECFICHHGEFDAVTPPYRRCRRCGHETPIVGAAQTFIVNDTLDAASVRRESTLDRFQGTVLGRFSARRARHLLVDIGSGSGKFLLHQGQRFARRCGVEITPAAVDFSRQKLGLAIVSDIDAIAGEIDVATAWHSLEHFPAPALDTLLRSLAAKIAPSGCVIVSVPNAASFQYRLFRSAYAFFDVPNHQHQFTPDSLARLFAAHGFRRAATVVSRPYNVFGYVQALLNLVVREHNCLYYRLKRGRTSASSLGPIVSIVLLPIAVPVALAFSLLDAVFPARQGVLTCCFEKERSEP
ncbi:MAG: class I SAM-dependent methyltransferase [Opitutaceae bacterium]